MTPADRRRLVERAITDIPLYGSFVLVGALMWAFVSTVATW